MPSRRPHQPDDKPTVTETREPVYLDGELLGTGVSFHVACPCGYTCNVATVNPDVAQDNADRHSTATVGPDDPFDGF